MPRFSSMTKHVRTEHALATPRPDRGVGAWCSVVLLAVGAATLGGCLGRPEIQDRWTRVDVENASITPNQDLPPGTTPITVRAAVTYRAIVTGFAVAELRASSSIRSTDVVLDPAAEGGARERMATDIDRILANSVSMGRATRAITGWDHLIQRIDFTFNGSVPAGVDSTGMPPGLFLLCYLGEGSEVELPDGSDSLVVTPFGSTAYEILPVGMELGVSPPGTP